MVVERVGFLIHAVGVAPLRRFEEARSAEESVACCYPSLVHTGVAVCPDWIWERRSRGLGPWEQAVARWREGVAAPFWDAMTVRAAGDGLRIDSFEELDRFEIGEGADTRMAWVEIVSPEGRGYGHRTDVQGNCWFGSDELAAMALDWGDRLAGARGGNPYGFGLERREAEREMATDEFAKQGIDVFEEFRRGNPKAKFAISALHERDRQAELEYQRTHPDASVGSREPRRM